MRSCGVPGCKGVLSLPGSKVHKLPDQQPQRGQWIKAVPQLNESKLKTPSICALHFTPSDYGKNRKYLKPTAVPSRHLKLDLKGGSQIEENIIPDIIQNTQFGKCESQDCQKIFIAAKSLSTQNQCLTKHIKGLEKKVQHLEAELKRGGSSSASGNFPFADKNDSKDGLFMLGPTQWRCITNRTTKGRNWTPEERSKANTLKTLCNTKCYNYIRKNIVPLPLPTELGGKDTDDDGGGKLKNEIPESNESDYRKVETTFVVKTDEESGISKANDEGEVHIVVPPEFQEFLVLQSISD